MDKKALFKISYGLYVVSTKVGEKSNGCIINTAVQVADNPIRLTIAVNKQNLTGEMIAKSGAFMLSVLSQETTFETIKNFGFQSGRQADKFASIQPQDYVMQGELELPRLASQLNAYLDCRVLSQTDLGSHILFLAEVVDAEILSQAPSLTYDYYQNNIKPAPAKAKTNTRWVCSICGYVYEGEEVPADFVCPICGVGPDMFNKEESPVVEDTPKTKWVCRVCGFVYEGEQLPEGYVCPICKHGPEVFDKVSAS